MEREIPVRYLQYPEDGHKNSMETNTSSMNQLNRNIVPRHNIPPRMTPRNQFNQNIPPRRQLNQNSVQSSQSTQNLVPRNHIIRNTAPRNQSMQNMVVNRQVDQNISTRPNNVNKMGTLIPNNQHQNPRNQIYRNLSQRGSYNRNMAPRNNVNQNHLDNNNINTDMSDRHSPRSYMNERNISNNNLNENNYINQDIHYNNYVNQDIYYNNYDNNYEYDNNYDYNNMPENNHINQDDYDNNYEINDNNYSNQNIFPNNFTNPDMVDITYRNQNIGDGYNRNPIIANKNHCNKSLDKINNNKLDNVRSVEKIQGDDDRKDTDSDISGQDNDEIDSQGKMRVSNKCFDWICLYTTPYLCLPLAACLVVYSRYPYHNYLSIWSLFFLGSGGGLTLLNYLSGWSILQNFIGCFELFLSIPIIITSIISFVFFMLEKPQEDYAFYNGLSIIIFDLSIIISSIKLFRRPCCVKPGQKEPLIKCCTSCPEFSLRTTRCGDELLELLEVCGCCCGGYCADRIPEGKFYQFIACNWFWKGCYKFWKWMIAITIACFGCIALCMARAMSPRRYEVVYV